MRASISSGQRGPRVVVLRIEQAGQQVALIERLLHVDHALHGLQVHGVRLAVLDDRRVTHAGEKRQALLGERSGAVVFGLRANVGVDHRLFGLEEQLRRLVVIAPN